MSFTVYIGGVEMTGDAHFINEASLELVNAIGQRDTCGLRIVSKDGSYSPASGASVEVYEDGTLRFGGSIRERNESLFGAAKITAVQCASWEAICDRRLVGQRSFDNNAGDIFTRLCIDYLDIEGITSSVVVTGPQIQVSLDWCTVREAFDKICELASDGTDTYLWDITPAKVARFYKQSSFAAPINVTDSSTTVLRPITRNESFGGSGVGYANKIRVRVGRFITDARTNTYSPNGSLDTFEFELPIAKVPTVTLSGVTKTVGIRDVDTGKDCYWQDGSTEVTFPTPPPSGTDTLVIEAQGYQSTVVDAGQDNDEVTARSIAEDNSGWYEALIELSDGKTTSEALAAGQAALADKGKIPNAIEYPTTTSGIRAGQYQTINLSAFGVNTTFIVESVRLFWAGVHYGWMVRAVNGSLANGWLQKLRKIATGGTSGASGTGGTSISTGNSLALTPALSSGLVGVPYTGPLVATGGEPPYTFSIATGTLPAWATLDAATGVISGTPDDVATTAFTARVTDTSSVTADAECSLVIADAGVAPGTAPGNVTIDSVTPDPRPTPITNKRGTSGGGRGVEVRYTAPDPIGTFLGVAGAVEVPDQSGSDNVPLDGSVNLGGGRRLGGPKDAIPIGPFAHADVAGVFRFTIPEPRTYPMTCRVRLMSYSAAIANDAASSPSLTFVISAPTTDKPNAGTAYCQNPTGISVISTRTGNHGGLKWRYVKVQQVPPGDPKFLGVQWIVKDAAGEIINASGIQSETEFELSFQELSAPQTCTVYACGSDGENINPLVEGITPSATVDIGTLDGTVNLGQSMTNSLHPALEVVNQVLGPKAGGITEDLIATFAVSAAKIADGAVATAKIADLSVITSKLAAGAVSSTKLADLAVEAAKLADSSVTATKIANAAVGTAAIANLAVGNGHIQNGAITNAKIGNLAVSTAQIQDAAITTAKIQNLAITTALIQDAAITDAKIGSLAANKITAGTISASVVLTSAALNISSGPMSLLVDTTNGVYYQNSNVRVQIREVSDGFGFAGIQVSRAADNYAITARADGIMCVAGSVSLGYTKVAYGEIRLRDSLGRETVITPTSITVNGRAL